MSVSKSFREWCTFKVAFYFSFIKPREAKTFVGVPQGSTVDLQEITSKYLFHRDSEKYVFPYGILFRPLTLHSVA